MKTKYTILMLISIFSSLIISCEKEDIQKPQDEIKENIVLISDFWNKEYISTKNSRVVISPEIKRSEEQTEVDLKFEWFINKRKVSNDRNLDYIIPYNTNIGELNCLYRVTNIYHKTKYVHEFKIEVTNPFGLGYYFLSGTEHEIATLSHINIDNPEYVTNTTAIENASFGFNPNSLSTKIKFDKLTSRQYNEISVTTQNEEYTHIKTNTIDMKLDLLLSSDDIYPSKHGINSLDMEYFIEDGKHVAFSDNSLITSYHKGEKYYWSNPINGVLGKTIYMYDKLKNKYFIIEPYSNGDITFDKVVPILNIHSFENEKIIGTKCKFNPIAKKEVVTILSSTDDKINIYAISYDFKNAAFNDIKSLSVLGEKGSAIYCYIKNKWYVGVNNNIYSIDENYSLTKEFTLNISNDNIVKLHISRDGNKLVCASYNEKTLNPMKGSITTIDLDSKTTKGYPNTLSMCVDIICCDGNY